MNFYVKTAFKNDGITTELKQEILDGEDGNIFTNCPGCGKEFHVDLIDIFDCDGDLYSTQIFCDECSRNGKAKEYSDFMNGKIPTFNGKTREQMERDTIEVSGDEWC